MSVLYIKRSLAVAAITAVTFLYSTQMHAQAKIPVAKTTAAAAPEEYAMPSGWHKSGVEKSKYLMGIAKGAGQKGTNAATIKSIGKVKGQGTLMQSFDPEKYLGEKVKLTGYIRSEQVVEWAGLWLRIDDSTKKSLVFDNMVNRPVKGTTAWTKCEIMVDVPENAANISYGALLHGSGQIWFDKLEFEIVKPAPTVEARLKEPTNLNFEK
jgi:hypothetical protein